MVGCNFIILLLSNYKGARGCSLAGEIFPNVADVFWKYAVVRLGFDIILLVTYYITLTKNKLNIYDYLQLADLQLIIDSLMGLYSIFKILNEISVNNKEKCYDSAMHGV